MSTVKLVTELIPTELAEIVVTQGLPVTRAQSAIPARAAKKAGR